MLKRRFLIFLAFLAFLESACASGLEWEDMTEGLTDRQLYCIATPPGARNDVYVGSESGLYVKDGSTKRWRSLFECRGQHRGVNHVLAQPDGAIYIATKNGFYGSRDYGKSWKRLFRGVGKENYCTYVTSGIESGIVYLGTLNGIFFSADGGKAWQRPDGVAGSSRITSVASGGKEPDSKVFFICDNEAYVSGKTLKGYRKIFGAESLKSFEGAETEDVDLEEAVSDGPAFILNHLAERQGVLYLGTSRGVFTSGDGGGSWSVVPGAGLLNRRVNYIIAPGEKEGLFAATKDGVYRYVKEDERWQGLYRGMEATDIRGLSMAPDGHLWALARSRVYRAIENNDLAAREKILRHTRRILAAFDNEPTINETLEMAITYAEVYPEKIKKWRRGAEVKAFFPKVTLGIDRNSSDTYEIYTSSTKSYWVDGPRDATDGWDLHLSWDIADLVWNDAQTSIDVRSKLMVQLRDDIVDEVTRAYFERRRLQVELLMDPPSDVSAHLGKTLRIQELTATLDGLTGSAFSAAIRDT